MDEIQFTKPQRELLDYMVMEALPTTEECDKSEMISTLECIVYMMSDGECIEDLNKLLK